MNDGNGSILAGGGDASGHFLCREAGRLTGWVLAGRVADDR